MNGCTIDIAFGDARRRHNGKLFVSSFGECFKERSLSGARFSCQENVTCRAVDKANGGSNYFGFREILFGKGHHARKVLE